MSIIDKKTWPLVYEYRNASETSKWYNLRDDIEASNTKIFYFYPANLSGDIMQAEIIKDIRCVFPFQFESNIHGVPFKDKFHISLLDKLLNLSEEKMLRLYTCFQSRKIKDFEWFIRVLLI